MDVHKGIIHSIQPDVYEKRIITASSDGIVRVFNNKSDLNEDVSLELECELSCDCGPVTKAIFINQGEIIASSYFSGKVILWKKEGLSYGKKLERQISSCSINDIDGAYNHETIKLYCACSDGNIRVISIDSNLNVEEKEFFSQRFGVTCISVSSSYVISGGLDYSVVLWKDEKEEYRFRDHKGYVRDVKICPENIFNIFIFATCSEDGSVFIYTKENESYKKQEIIIDEPVYSLSWSRSGISLSIGYGQNKFKCFVPSVDGEFKEVEISKID